MNRWVRSALEEILRVAAFLTLMVGCLFITVPFLIQATFSHQVVSLALALVHVSAIMAWLAHSFLFQAHHAWKVMRGRGKGILAPPRLSWHWQVGYVMINALCLVGEWWWSGTLQSAAAAEAAVAGADALLGLA